jgi:alginate O-acetyltransferase complex protein AlgI
VATVLKWALTFYLVLLGWVLFRATSIDSALDIIVNMHTFSGLPVAGPVAGIVALTTLFTVVLMHLLDWFVIARGDKFESKRWVFWPALIFIHGLFLMIGEPSSEFIYFQF